MTKENLDDFRALAQSYGRLQIVDVIEDALRADPRQLVTTLTRLCANVRRQHNTYLPDAVPTTRDDVDTAPHETVTEGRVVR